MAMESIHLACMDTMGIFHCACDPDFTGELCQTNIDDCVGVNCSGKGQCVDGVNNFICECAPGFSGPLCSEGTHAMHADHTITLTMFIPSESLLVY